MKTIDLWTIKADCCGCELCARSCPKQVICMKPDEEGFLYPFISDENNCINCKLCMNVCPIKNPGRAPVHIEESFSYSLPIEEDLKRSASGGIITAISRSFIKKGGVVYGVVYEDEFQSIRYKRATTIEELEAFRGSKYVQAEKGGVYSQVKSDVDDGKKILFVGLPCEVSALYHYIAKRDNLYTISLICHGPTSQKVHRDYLKSLPIPFNEISYLSLRYKKTGWKPYFIHIKNKKGDKYEEIWNKSDYGVAFQYLKRPSCYTCKYKSKNDIYGLQSDITVGDFHAVKKGSLQYNKWGVSQVSIQSDKGYKLLFLINIKPDNMRIPHSLIMKSNRALHAPIPQRGSRKRFVKDYLNHSLHHASSSWMVKITDGLTKIGRQVKRLNNINRLSMRLMRKR